VATWTLEIPKQIDPASPYFILMFFPGEEQWWATAWSGPDAYRDFLSTLEEKDPKLLEAWFAFSERFVTATDPAPELRLVGPPRDQEPPEST
jgi:hypothetical protein